MYLGIAFSTKYSGWGTTTGLRLPTCWAVVGNVIAILSAALMFWREWELHGRPFSLSPLELINAVAHNDHSARNPLRVLAERAEDNASFASLVALTSNMDAENEGEKTLRYMKGEDGRGES